MASRPKKERNMPLDPEDDEFPEEGIDLTQHEDVLPQANVDTKTGPVELSDAPPTVSEPQAVIGEAPSPEGERAEGEEQDGIEQEPLPEFDQKVREDFEGLLYIGKLRKSFKFLGHEFVIRTLTTNETLEVGLLQKPYRDSMGDLRAYQAVTCAACVVTVDGVPLPMPLTDREEDELDFRFRYVRKNWFPVVLDQVYEQYLSLEYQVSQVVQAMGEALG